MAEVLVGMMNLLEEGRTKHPATTGAMKGRGIERKQDEAA
jgi:hypothetical protein